MSTPSDHRQVDTGFPRRRHDGDDIKIVSARMLHCLLLQHSGQGFHLITKQGGLFEIQGFGCLKHAPFYFVQHIAGMPIQKPHRPRYIGLIGLL